MDLLFYPLVLAALLLPVIWVGRRHTDHVETLALAAGYGVLGAAAIGLARFFVALPASTPRLAGLLAFGLCVVAAVIRMVIDLPGTAKETLRNSSFLISVLLGEERGQSLQQSIRRRSQRH